MHYPLELSLGKFNISVHAIFEITAFAAGFRYFLFLRRKQSDPIPESNRIWIIIGAAAGAFIFSRLIGALENPIGWLKAPNSWLYFYMNKTIVGGLLGGLMTVEMTKYFLKERASSGDLFTYPLLLAIIIGRLGCFTMGVHEPTFGLSTTLPWAMDLGDGVLRHPVAIYEIIFLLTVWLSLNIIERKALFPMGMRFKIFMVVYLIFRFLLDYIKPAHPILLNLSTIQLACLAGLLYYYRTLILLVFKPAKLVMHERPT
jgi:phosphatidylglycerol---prolipoprotein diacylglyceryl transferase